MARRRSSTWEACESVGALVGLSVGKTAAVGSLVVGGEGAPRTLGDVVGLALGEAVGVALVVGLLVGAAVVGCFVTSTGTAVAFSITSAVTKGA